MSCSKRESCKGSVYQDSIKEWNNAASAWTVDVPSFKLRIAVLRIALPPPPFSAYYRYWAQFSNLDQFSLASPWISIQPLKWKKKKKPSCTVWLVYLPHTSASSLNLFPRVILQFWSYEDVEWFFPFQKRCTSPQLHSPWIMHEEFICLCVGEILSFRLHANFFPLLCLFLSIWAGHEFTLPVRGIFQARCFTHFWVWLDTRFLILNCCWERWNTVVVLSSTQGAVPTGERGGWISSNQGSEGHGRGLWLQAPLSQGS